MKKPNKSKINHGITKPCVKKDVPYNQEVAEQISDNLFADGD
jgi:hypothetical protein